MHVRTGDVGVRLSHGISLYNYISTQEHERDNYYFNVQIVMNKADVTMVENGLIPELLDTIQKWRKFKSQEHIIEGMYAAQLRERDMPGRMARKLEKGDIAPHHFTALIAKIDDRLEAAFGSKQGPYMRPDGSSNDEFGPDEIPF